MVEAAMRQLIVEPPLRLRHAISQNTLRSEGFHNNVQKEH